MKKFRSFILFFVFAMSACIAQPVANPAATHVPSSAPASDYYSAQGYSNETASPQMGVQQAVATLEDASSGAVGQEAPSPYTGTMGAVHNIADIIFGICRLVGLLFVLTAIFYFDKYRKRQGDVTFGQAFWTLIVGMAVFILPTIAQYAQITKTIDKASSGENPPVVSQPAVSTSTNPYG